MMYLYDKTTTDFTTNGEPIRHAYDAHVIRDEGFYLKFKVLLDAEEHYKQIKDEMIVSAMTPDGINQFRIFDISKNTDHVEVVALQLFYYLDHRLVRPLKFKAITGVSMVRFFAQAFVSDIQPYTFDSSVMETHDFDTKTTDADDNGYHNALETIQRIATRWDSEFLLNGFDVRMVKRLGKRTNALLYEKKNISEFESKDTMREVITRIHATSKWTLSSDDAGYIEDGDNEREIKVVVDSPLIDTYSQIYERAFVNNDCRTEEELRKWAMLKYTTEHRDKPKRTIEVNSNIIDGTEINYGDELVLKYLVHDIDETIRCVGYDYDPIGKEFYNLTLGDWRQSFAGALNRSVADVSERQKSQLAQLARQVQIVQMAANGINRVTYGPSSVPNPQHGDVWYYYELDRPNQVEMRIYNADEGRWIRADFDVEAFEVLLAEVDEQVKVMEAEIEKIRAETESIDELKRRVERIKGQADQVSEDTNTLLELVGNDGQPIYNRNRATVTILVLDKDTANGEVAHNGEGFIVGETYTISFSAECVPIEKRRVEMRFVEEV